MLAAHHGRVRAGTMREHTRGGDVVENIEVVVPQAAAAVVVDASVYSGVV